MYAQKLQAGDEVRVIAPSRSLAIISQGVRDIANRRFAELGLKLTFGKHVEESDEFFSSSIQSRVEDLHDAFLDTRVKAVIAVIGGFNSNQLLRYIDWEIIKNNPKILCGYSDTTALNNAMLAKTGLVSYSGPAYSTFGQELYFDYTLEYFRKCLFSDGPFEIQQSEIWSDDAWYMDQKNRKLIKSDGFFVLNEGEATGTLVGSNLCTFNLLQGTEYFPSLEHSLLFLEDDAESVPHMFDRDLQSLIHMPDFKDVKGLVIGRFQNASNMSRELLTKIIKTKKELDGIPVLADVDFGHTDPRITLPIGGEARLSIKQGDIKLEIIRH
ncbi:LD-carboxypeptidase [Candidatus Uhrbacteria bacterium]|nr:LD-carboxypeptidase [Candidatus Uhrbacteria bacterium]